MVSGLSKIFVSHSKDDLEGQNFLHAVFSLEDSRFRPFFYAVAGPKAPRARTLRDHIRESKALFVLLSEKMNNPHTISWLGFEIGLATQQGLPIVVIEPDYRAPIPIPVPSTTHYTLRPKLPRSLSGTIWAAIGRTACIEPAALPKTPREGFWGGLADFLEFVAEKTFAVEGRFQRAQCRHEDCRAEFFVPTLMIQEKYFCPVCRRKTWGIMAELADAARRGTIPVESEEDAK